MFIGHVGVALAAKRATPRTSLGTLVLAAQLVDVLWPVMLIAGFEHVRISPGDTAVTPLDFYDYPWTHSLAMTLVWAAAFAGVHYGLRKDARAAIVTGLLVPSHWLLDLLVHRPDLPLVPGGAVYGLGLWNSRGATAALEVSIFCVGLLLYLRTTTARDAIGRWGFGAFVAVVLLAYIANLQGTPPPSVEALQWTALVLAALLWAWAWWTDAHRRPQLTSRPPSSPHPRTSP
jgi:hypothetical protein